MDRLLSGAGGTLSLTTYDSAGAPADVDGTNAPTLVVKDSAATSVLTPAGSRSSAGVYTATIPVTQTILDLYDVTWTWPSGATRKSQYEIVGSFLFSDAELRAFDSELTIATYSTTKVRDVRERVEEFFAQECRVSFTRRGRREYLDGDGSACLFTSERLVQSVVSMKIDSTTQSLTNLKVSAHGKLEWTSGVFAWGVRNVEVLYEHGFMTPPPSVADAGMRYARYLLVPGAGKNDERITGISMDVGFARLSVAGRDGPTGLPDVDTVLARYMFHGAIA